MVVGLFAFFVLRLPSISNPTWEIDIFHLQWRCIYIKYFWYIFFPGLIDWFFLLLPRCCLTIFTEFRLLQLLGSFLWYMLSHVANHKSYNIGRISFYIESKTMRDRAACTRGKWQREKLSQSYMIPYHRNFFLPFYSRFRYMLTTIRRIIDVWHCFHGFYFSFFSPVISTINASIGHANKTCHK